MKQLLALLGLGAVFTANAAGFGDPVVFTGMCDASAAIALDGDVFVAASDEDNLLRFYRLSQPGKPIFTHNLNPFLAGRKKSPEADIEGGARLGNRLFWITSHEPDDAGQVAPHRCRLVALEVRQQGANFAIQPVGRIYANLIPDLAREPKLARFRLAQAARLSRKAAGHLNIEALASAPEGRLLIGFRSPVHEGRALLLPLLNPNEVLDGQPSRFGEPILLDLGGLGLRGIGSTGRGYYLLAGPGEEKAESRLFFWVGGTESPQPVEGLSLKGIMPEAVCFQDANDRSDFLVLSDDGNRKMDGKTCKDLPESRRQFRAYRIMR